MKKLNQLSFEKFCLFVLLVIILFSLSCMRGEKAIQNIELKPIVVIFDSIKSNYDTIFNPGGPEQCIVGGPIFSVKLSSSQHISLKVKDTIEIVPELDYVIVSHKFSPYAYVDFILQSGDTANIKYINDVVYVDILNRETKLFDVNYDYLKMQRYPLVEGMRFIDIMQNNNHALFGFKKWLKGDKSYSNKRVLDEFYPKLLNELEDERMWLDSLYQTKLISQQEYRFYKERNKYTTLMQNIKNKTPEAILTELKEYNDSLYINDIARYYKGYMYNIGWSHAKILVDTLRENQYTETYDDIENCKEISGQLSLDLRSSILMGILQNSSFDVRKEYFNKFASSIADTALIGRMKSYYANLLNPEIATSEDLILLAANGKKTTLSDVLKQCKGKIVYVDFWASWCDPCLREMPFSKKLREDVAYKDVVFIYLALNDKQSRWEAVWEKADLKNQAHNYLILNSKDAPFVKKYKISSIPRYMIFDKEGQLLNNNAPTPSDKNLDILSL